MDKLKLIISFVKHFGTRRYNLQYLLFNEVEIHIDEKVLFILHFEIGIQTPYVNSHYVLKSSITFQNTSFELVLTRKLSTLHTKVQVFSRKRKLHTFDILK